MGSAPGRRSCRTRWWGDLEQILVESGVYPAEDPPPAIFYEAAGVSWRDRVIHVGGRSISAEDDRVIYGDAYDVTRVQGRAKRQHPRPSPDRQGARGVHIARPPVQRKLRGTAPQLLRVAAPLTLLPVVGERQGDRAW